MSIIAWIVLGIIIIQGIVNIKLVNSLDKERKSNEKYYASLRREFDIRLQEKQKDIELNNEIIEGMNSIYGRS